MFSGILIGAVSMLVFLVAWNSIEDAVRALRHRRERLAEVSPFTRLSHTLLSQHAEEKERRQVDRLFGVRR